MPTLREVNVTWGNADLMESAPGVETFASSIYMPCRPRSFFGDDPTWGLYALDGSLLDAATYRRGADRELIGQSLKLDIDVPSLDVIDERFVYGGPMIPHYGHFLTASLPRLWHGRSEAGQTRRILYHGPHDIALWFDMDFSRAIFDALGLRPEHFVRLETPSLVRDLVVARPAMEELNFIHRILDDVTTKIGRAYDVHRQPRDRGPLFLSKTRLQRGIARFEHEAILESRLAARGFDIVHPQELSFAAQIQTLARATAITGATGSSLHTCLFIDRPSRICALSPINAIASNFLLIDRLKGNDATYVYPESASPRLQEQGFHAIWAIADMGAVADELADLI